LIWTIGLIQINDWLIDWLIIQDYAKTTKIITKYWQEGSPWHGRPVPHLEVERSNSCREFWRYCPWTISVLWPPSWKLSGCSLAGGGAYCSGPTTDHTACYNYNVKVMCAHSYSENSGQRASESNMLFQSSAGDKIFLEYVALPTPREY